METPLTYGTAQLCSFAARAIVITESTESLAKAGASPPLPTRAEELAVHHWKATEPSE
jgi:hypothetical protein